MENYIPDRLLPKNHLCPPSRDDMLAAGSDLVRRSLQAPHHRPQASQSIGPLQVNLKKITHLSIEISVQNVIAKAQVCMQSL